MSQNNVIDKKSLVVACQARNREAQNLLYTTYRRKMMKIIRQYVADYDMAQDVLHDGFLIILSQIQSLRNPESLDYWMATIMKNLAIHTLSQIEFEDILEEQEEEIDDEFDSDLSYDELMALIHQLPNGYQTVFRLAVLEDKSHQEIADMLGISPKSSASQLARAKEKLCFLINEHRKKAGLLAMLLLVVGSIYVYFMNKEAGVDVAIKMIVNKTKHQQNATEEKQNDIVEVAKSYMAQDLANTESKVSPVAVDTTICANKEQAYDETICETTDSTKQHSDTTKIAPQKEAVEYKLIVEKDTKSILPSFNKNWNINFSTNALGIGSSSNNNNTGNGILAAPDPNGNHNGNTEKETTSVHHLKPVTFGVRFSKELSTQWTIETGVQYSLLRSDITKTIGKKSYTKNIKAHFVGVPIAAKYRFLQWKKANVYALGGISLDIPIYSTIDSKFTGEHSKLRYPISFSFDMGIGFEYHISPTTSLFIQPSLNYHIMDKSENQILWQDQPLSFDLPMGIRISW